MLRIILCCGFFLSTSLTAASDEIAGLWVGTFQLSQSNETPVRINISKNRNVFEGSLNAPFSGLMKIQLENIRVDQKQIHFELNVEKEKLEFEGGLSNDQLKGKIHHGDFNGDFQLLRTLDLTPQDLAQNFGIYQLAPNRTIYIRTWDELGENQLTYLDSSGNVAPLYPTTQGDFIMGSGLWMPFPTESRLRFGKNGIVSLSGSGSQTAKKLASYHEEEVQFQSGEFKLSGTLLTPSGLRPYPAVVFIHGSGRVTRDFMGPLPYHFVQNGIAVLSYDKRGSGKSEGNWLKAAFTELADDARAAIGFLKTRKEIDSSKIGIFGISQGGWIGPMVAAENRDISFLILVSAPAITPAQQEISRLREELKAEGLAEKAISEQIEKLTADLNSLRDPSVQKELAGEVIKLEKEQNQDVLLDSGPSNPRFLLWYAGLMDHDPLPVLKKVKAPVLAIYGELDRGVPPAESQPILEQALAQTQLTVRVFPGANHAMLESSTGSMKEFPFLKRFVPGFLDSMVKWVKERT